MELTTNHSHSGGSTFSLTPMILFFFFFLNQNQLSLYFLESKLVVLTKPHLPVWADKPCARPQESHPEPLS